MGYNFDQVVERRNTNSIKWDYVENMFGAADLLPLWVADMDFQVPEAIVEAVTMRAAHGVYGYTAIPDSVYQAICKWVEKRHGWRIEKSWIGFTSGVVTALNIAVHAFTKPGDKVLIQSPVYRPFFMAIENNGRQIVNSPLKLVNGKYQIDFVELEKQFDSRVKMMILCNPHNPVGRVWTKEELERLGELCLKHNVVILSDEIHSDFIYPGHKHISLASLSEDLAQNTITCIAPNKTFNVAGLSTGAVVIPNTQLKTQFDIALENAAVKTNLFGIIAMEAAYRFGEEWLDELLKYLEGNRQFLAQFIEERIPQIHLIQPEGTFLTWLDCRELGMEPAELRRFMIEKAKVGLNDGVWFGPGGEGFQRLNIGCPRSIIQEALERIEQAVKNL